MRSLLNFILVLIPTIMLYSCVSLEQKTTVNEDGSGNIAMHYWTHTSNITGDEIAGFGFTSSKVEKNYTSENSEVNSILIEKNEADTTTHVKFNLKFKSIERLPEARGFSKVRAGWEKDKEGKINFIYTLLKDSANAISPGMDEYLLKYEFIFPGEVLQTNGEQDGSTVKWENTIANLTQDVDYTATIKTREKSCGLFGIELPIILIAGLIFTLSRKKICIK